MPLLAADPVTVFDRAARSAGTSGRTHSQALERIAPGLPMAPGKVERREFEYRRHGTQMLIAALDVAHRLEGVITRTERILRAFSAAC
jgi:hypothetical protein